MDDLVERTAATQPLFVENVAEARVEGIEVAGDYERDRIFARLAHSAIDTTYGHRLGSNTGDSLVLTVAGRAPSLGRSCAGASRATSRPARSPRPGSRAT